MALTLRRMRVDKLEVRVPCPECGSAITVGLGRHSSGWCPKSPITRTGKCGYCRLVVDVTLDLTAKQVVRRHGDGSRFKPKYDRREENHAQDA